MPFSCHSFLSALSMWLTGNTQSALDCSQATHSLLWTIPRNMAHRQHTVCSGLFPQSPKHGSQATHTVCSGLFTGNTHGLLWTVHRQHTRSALDCSHSPQNMAHRQHTRSALDCSQATHGLLWTVHRQHTRSALDCSHSPQNMAHRQHTRSALDCSQATHTVCSGLFPKIGCLLFRTIRVSVPVASIYLEHPFLTTEVTQMCLLLLSALLSVMKNLQHP